MQNGNDNSCYNPTMKKLKRKTVEEKYAELMEKIPEFRLMDDTFMTAFFDGQIECTEFVLRIILNKNDLKVISVATQREIHSVGNRSARLDVYASDSNGKFYDIEVQNSDDGASVKRARFNSSMMDSTFLKKSEFFDKLPETYVIFITENDVLEGNLPIYHIDRKITELENKDFNDEQHIIYVNGAYKSDDALGKLMHDFQAKNPKDMKYEVLSERANFLKTNGGAGMCKIMNDLIREERKEERKETQIELLVSLVKDKLISLQEAAKRLSVSEEEMKELIEDEE